ncbi:hypothetical protein [Nonomuraea cypriaca]|uniref:hypothetical protein n=1 Tax=Nonomuraea cypriaca TaxID=1187855 RepID=UPI001A9C7264|nr:hypothetical protein [Nonomuraea cypriaca]
MTTSSGPVTRSRSSTARSSTVSSPSSTPAFRTPRHHERRKTKALPQRCRRPGTSLLCDNVIHLSLDGARGGRRTRHYDHNASTIRVIGIDANRTNIAPATLGGFGMTGYGAKATMASRKIDYLFVKGAVQPSSIDHTVSGTKSNHLALYGFIDF